MSQENVDDIGQGRVPVEPMPWTLAIDEYGGLEAAVARAAELAELEDYRITNCPNKKIRSRTTEQLEEDMQTSWIKYQLETNTSITKPYKISSILKAFKLECLTSLL